ncbi:MAG: S9 family peptidase [Acidobacteriota bacterium]
MSLFTNRPGSAHIGLLLIAAMPLSLASAARAQEPESPRPMTVDDALAMQRIGDPVLSPDGRTVLYTQTSSDWDENKRHTKVYRVDDDGSQPWQFLGEAGGSQLGFSPDGRYVTLLRKSEKKGKGKGKQQIFWMRSSGGEAVALTEHPSGVRRYKWAADSQSLVFLAEDERSKEERKAIESGEDAVFVNEGPNGQNRGQWTNLWHFDLEAKESKQLTKAQHVISSFDLSPDGRQIAFTARTRNRRNDGYLTEVFVQDLESGASRRLTENEAPESGVLWSPKGDVFLYSAADDETWKNRNDKIWLMDPELGEHSLVSRSYEGAIRNVTWHPDGEAVFFTGQQGTQSNLFRMDVRNGSFEQLSDTDGWMRISAFSSDRSKVLYSYDDADTPSDLWLADLEASDGEKPHGLPARRLTDANPAVAKLQLARAEVVRWKSRDGTEIEGLVHFPVGYREGEKYPLMLNIHGGPAGFFANSFRSSYHLYAGLGYLSLSPNVRGSSGYTDRLQEGNTVERDDGIGKGDYDDLMTGVDALIERGLVDPEKMGLRGWSYGGILGGWTITQTNRFKAASIGAGVYDWTSEYGPGFNHDVKLWHIGGTPWENPEGWRNQSALTFVANIETPTLLLHGDADTTDTEQQSMMMFAAIQDVGKAPVRYIKFPRQPHGIREPRHVRIKDVEEIRWMQKHVLGVDWEPPKREKKKDEDSDEDESETSK